MSPDVLKYYSRAIVRYLNGNTVLFNFYVRQAIKIYEKELMESRLHVPIEEILDDDIKTKLRSILQ